MEVRRNKSETKKFHVQRVSVLECILSRVKASTEVSRDVFKDLTFMSPLKLKVTFYEMCNYEASEYTKIYHTSVVRTLHPCQQWTGKEEFPHIYLHNQSRGSAENRHSIFNQKYVSMCMYVHV